MLPVDIALANQSDSGSANQEPVEFKMRMFWRCFYWGSFIYSFFVMPFAMSFVISGEKEANDKVNFAIKRVTRTYTIYAGVGAAFLCFLWMRGTFDGSSNEFTLRGFVIALGAAYGLLQIIVLLGYGLVSIPKHLFFSSSFQQQMDMALCAVDQSEDRLQLVKLKIQDLALCAKALKSLGVVL